MGAANLPTAFDLTQPYDWYNYGSKHDAGIVNFAMCDGSVRSFRTIGNRTRIFQPPIGTHSWPCPATRTATWWITRS